MEKLSGYVRAFDSKDGREKADVDFIKEKFGYPEEDIKVPPTPSDYLAQLTKAIQAWLKTVGYPSDCASVDGKVIEETLR